MSACMHIMYAPHKWLRMFHLQNYVSMYDYVHFRKTLVKAHAVDQVTRNCERVNTQSARLQEKQPPANKKNIVHPWFDPASLLPGSTLLRPWVPLPRPWVHPGLILA